MAGTPLKANTSGRAADQPTSGSLWIGFGIGVGILILVFILLVGFEIWLTKSGPNAVDIK